jgi:hypothetical protein
MLRTLRDAGEYMQALPRAKLKQPEWEIVAEMVLAAVEGSGPLMFAEIAMRKAVNAGKPAPDPEPTPRRRGSKRVEEMNWKDTAPAHAGNAGTETAVR